MPEAPPPLATEKKVVQKGILGKTIGNFRIFSEIHEKSETAQNFEKFLCISFGHVREIVGFRKIFGKFCKNPIPENPDFFEFWKVSSPIKVGGGST